MGIFFTLGEKKDRAGVYQRYVNYGGTQAAGASDGVVAAVFKSNWGELNKVLTFESAEAAANYLGTGGTSGTIDLLNEIFAGGAKIVKAVRLGSGGTKASAELLDTATTPAPVIALTAKCEGDRALSYQVRTSLQDGTKKEFLVFEGVKLLEKILFTGTADDLIAKESQYFDFVKVAGYTGAGTVAIAAVTAADAGTNPTVDNEAYSDAFVLLEPHAWNTICVDTVDTTVHPLLTAYMARVYETGKMAFAVMGEPISVEFATRLAHAKAFNSKLNIYVGGGFYDINDNLIDGYKAAARIAGLVAATSSAGSFTHATITGATRPAELLTNEEYNQTIDNGMLTFSISAKGIVWIESGITTLVSLGDDDDEGWKKIKRAKIRFELMTRASETVEPLKLKNNDDGRATVIQAVQGVLNAMINEEKLLPGAKIVIDANNLPAGDSAWFEIQADDIDALEKAYFTFKFRFAA